MKLVLFADNYVGFQIAKFLINNFPGDLLMLVCLNKNDIYNYAKDRNISVVDFNEDKESLSDIVCDLGVLAWWPTIIKEPLLSMPKNGYINTHPSLLPYNRGKNYNFWALVEQVPFGVTLHFIDTGIDTGDIVFQVPIDHDWCDTGESLYKKAQTEMIDLFINSYPLIRSGKYVKKSQDIKSGTFHYSSELEKICEINLDEKYQGRHILNLLRARTFEGYPGCYFYENGNKYEIKISINKVIQ